METSDSRDGSRLGTPQEEHHVTELLDHLLDDIDAGVVSQLTLAELRDVRDRFQSIEGGLSYGRRLIQGRLDIVMCELERRADNGGESLEDLLGRLPSVLAQHTRGSGSPRPVRDIELPPFTDDLAAAADGILDPNSIAHLVELGDTRISGIIDDLTDLERQVSAKRHEVHRVIDELQEEIVSRYRTGAASVDDLLR